MDPARGSAASTSAFGRLRRWLSGWGFKQWRRAALVVVLAATAAFGGLDTVDKQVTDVKPGELFDNGRFDVTVQRASLVNEVRLGERVLAPPQPGRRYLALVVTMRNRSTLPGNVFWLVDLVGVPDAKRRTEMRLADGTVAVRLGPGLEDRIVMMWDVPDTAVSVGDDVQVRIWKEVRKLNATVGEGWVRGLTDYGRVTVPVEGPRS